jgi:adenosylcobinamide kinase/adenosylcobinamide-phosphate guanylyltransferase
MLTLITGGARSGKSRFAQALCNGAETVTYIATARADDNEMRRRITRHQELRPPSWLTIEEPLAVADAVGRSTPTSTLILIDCITIWLSNLLFEWRSETESQVEENAREQVSRLVEASRTAQLIAVTNEVGSGIVPDSAVARQFRDLQGFVNQQLAQSADSVYLVVSGIPVRIKE